MTNISNPFALACRHLPQKYTISTLQSVNIADNQDSYGYIYEIFQISRCQERTSVNAFHYVCIPTRLSLEGLLRCGMHRRISCYF